MNGVIVLQLLLLLAYSTTIQCLFLACDPNPCNIGSDCSDENGDGTAECTCIGDTCDTPEGNTPI